MNKISYEEFVKRYQEKIEPHMNKRVTFQGEGEMFRVFIANEIMEEWKEEQMAETIKQLEMDGPGVLLTPGELPVEIGMTKAGAEKERELNATLRDKNLKILELEQSLKQKDLKMLELTVDKINHDLAKAKVLHYVNFFSEWGQFKRACMDVIKIDGYVALKPDEFEMIVEKVERAGALEDALDTKNEVLDEICNKLADIRNLFDESDQIAEGHTMDDVVASPYAVACYAENKIKRLKGECKRLIEEKRLQETEEKKSVFIVTFSPTHGPDLETKFIAVNAYWDSGNTIVVDDVRIELPGNIKSAEFVEVAK